MVAEVLLPPPPAAAASTYRKLRARGAWDFALAGAAVSLGLRGKKVERARIVLSGVAPVPWRVELAEREIVGHELSDALIERAAHRAATGATSLSGNAYKVALVRGAVAEALSELRAMG